MSRRLLLSLALCSSLAACAAEPAGPSAATPGKVDAAVRAAVEQLVPGVPPDAIGPSPIPGFREVAVAGQVVYISDDGRYLIQGSLVDIVARENLTSAAEAGQRKGLLDKVGADRGILFAAAEPKYTVTVFTDIDCGFCRRMHQQIGQYNALGISVRYLFYPRAGLSSESFDKAVSVWCASDRRKALTDAKAGVELPKASCTNPVTMDYDLGRQVGLDGTPAVYDAGGRQLGGYVPPQDLLARLDELAAKAER